MNWDNFSIDFTLNKDGVLFWANNKNENVLKCNFENGMLDISIEYDYLNKPPLHLSSIAHCGDKVKICILPYRLELYVNDNLSDEEWPCGNNYLSKCPIIDNQCTLHIQEFSVSKKQVPNAFLGVFQNAEGWKPEEKIFVGDCMPYCHNGIYHVLYLKDRHHHHSKWGLGAHQWSHISTNDFVNWNIHPMAVEIDDSNEGSICTGSWICDSTTHYLFYTVRSCDNTPAKIRRSVSKDGYHFEKDRTYAFTLSEKYTVESARDPKIVKDEAGLYHMIVTTSLKDSYRGCLAHLTSTDLEQWHELDEPLYIAPEGQGEPECPDYFYKDGFYYLIYSLHGTGYYQYSEKPFTDWQIADDPIIPCKNVPKAAIWNERLIFTGFNGDGSYAGTMTFLEAIVQKDGQLKYKSFI